MSTSSRRLWLPHSDSKLVSSPIKFKVRSSLLRDSQPSRFSTFSILLMATLRYSKRFNLCKFSRRAIRLDWRRRIFRLRHQFWMCSMASISSWCKEISSRVLIRRSLCSDFLRTSSSVTTILNGSKSWNISLISTTYWAPYWQKCDVRGSNRKC